MNKSRIFRSILGSAFLGLAMFAAVGAQAQTATLETSYQCAGGSKSVNIAEAKVLDLTPGAQGIVDRNGNTVACTFTASGPAILATGYVQYNYAAKTAGGLRLYNVTQISATDCVAGNSSITWYVGAPETITDSCAFAYGVNGRAHH